MIKDDAGSAMMRPGMHASAGWLFFGDIRVSTMLLWAAFVFVGVVHRDLKQALLAGLVWLLGFEVAWQTVHWITTAGHLLSWSITVFAASAGFVLLLQRKTVRPSLPLIGVALAISAVWVATGFHVNEHNVVHFDSLAEALNEGGKTLWGLAYLFPLWRRERSDERGIEPLAGRPGDVAA